MTIRTALFWGLFFVLAVLLPTLAVLIYAGIWQRKRWIAKRNTNRKFAPGPRVLRISASYSAPIF